ncbi:hypothetical protein Poly51_48980 [Rubripirellula tenax]|uniref:Uncharacterized protein n=1 Tax=Rubripirellula tenax TaxID=2528015 RepID=A0A5C6EKM1_9BACT|nr:hypothetical protein Poly51_48980 [Rubripirellula tenax]
MASFDQYLDELTGKAHSALYLRSRRYRLSYPYSASVLQAPAWCRDCSAVVASEHMPTKDEIEYERNQLIAITRGIKNDMAFFFCTPEAATKELENRNRFWSAIADRRSPPRCLDCFGVDLLPLPTNDDTLVTIPNGPLLRYDTNGFADVGPEATFILDIEGRLVRRDGG